MFLNKIKVVEKKDGTKEVYINDTKQKQVVTVKAKVVVGEMQTIEISYLVDSFEIVREEIV